MATQAQTRKARRAPLDREQVLRAAVKLADLDGIEAVSMRRVGQELGVEAMSLYNHIGGKDELLDGMTDMVVSEIDPVADGLAWKAALRQRILAARAVMLRHPWASTVIASRKTISTTMMGYFESMVGLLRAGGFSVDLTHHALHVLGSRILGFAQELYDDTESLAESPEIAEIMLRQMSAAYPNLAEMASQVMHDDSTIVGSGCDDQFEFEFALDLILDGLERQAAAR